MKTKTSMGLARLVVVLALGIAAWRVIGRDRAKPGAPAAPPVVATQPKIQPAAAPPRPAHRAPQPAMVADGDALQVVRIVPGSGAFDAGIEFGDHIVAIDGVPVTQLGVDRAFASLRGQPGTTVALTLRRADRYIQLVVERRLLGS